MSATVPVPRVRYQYAEGLVVAAAASIAAPFPGQEPPETVAVDDDPDDEDDGADAGAWRPPPELELPPDELELDAPLEDRVAEVPVPVVV
jgi:hypothetical protein